MDLRCRFTQRLIGTAQITIRDGEGDEPCGGDHARSLKDRRVDPLQSLNGANDKTTHVCGECVSDQLF
jgi:hypothetical protein